MTEEELDILTRRCIAAIFVILMGIAIALVNAT